MFIFLWRVVFVLLNNSCNISWLSSYIWNGLVYENKSIFCTFFQYFILLRCCEENFLVDPQRFHQSCNTEDNHWIFVHFTHICCKAIHFINEMILVQIFSVWVKILSSFKDMFPKKVIPLVNFILL